MPRPGSCTAMTEQKPRTLLHAFSTFRVGGSQIRFCTLANRFGARYRHVIFSMDGRYDCRDRLADGLNIEIADVLAKKPDTLGNRRRFRSYLRAHRPDLLVTYNWGSLEWAMANWPPLLRHVHIEDGFGPEEADRQLLRRVLTRRLVLSRSQIIVPSRTLEKIALNVWRLDPRRVRYIPNGIDCARFSAPGIAPFDWPGSGLIVGTLAALRPEKNLRRLLDAFRLVRSHFPCRLLIAGDGPERESLETHVEALGLREHVRFTGHVGEPERIYAALDIFALSSDTEQMPITVIEAMAAGLPIAATEVGDISQMISDESRPFLAERDAASLARSILRLLGSPELRARIGAANRKVAETRFEERTMTAAYAELFG
jgi:glycosyltransferase involved in cell wall biosynthesis